MLHNVRFIVLFFLFSPILSGIGQAQPQSITGRDFWVLLYHGTLINNQLDTVLFYVVGDTATVGYIENEHYGYHYDFQNVTVIR